MHSQNIIVEKGANMKNPGAKMGIGNTAIVCINLNINVSKNILRITATHLPGFVRCLVYKKKKQSLINPQDLISKLSAFLIKKILNFEYQNLITKLSFDDYSTGLFCKQFIIP
jgi:hypothetical protein